MRCAAIKLNIWQIRDRTKQRTKNSHSWCPPAVASPPFQGVQARRLVGGIQAHILATYATYTSLYQTRFTQQHIETHRRREELTVHLRQEIVVRVVVQGRDSAHLRIFTHGAK